MSIIIGGGGDVKGPGSAIIGEVPIFADAGGKELATTPVTIDPSTRKVTLMGATEQDGNAYFPQNTVGVVWTNTGLSSGTILFTLKTNSTGTFLLTGNEGSRTTISSSQFRILIASADTALYVIGGITTEKNLNVQGDAKFKVYTNDVSNPPTDAELDAIFGTPATVGAGFTADIDDAGAGNNFYTVKSDGSNWWIQTYTKAV